MADAVHPQDAILYVRSEHTIRKVLETDGNTDAVRHLQERGCYTFATAYFTSGHATTGGGQAMWGSPPGHKAVEGEELPDEEVQAIYRVREAAAKRGRTLHIVDLGRETHLHRYISEHLHHLKAFPVLMRPDGRRLEGCDAFTDQNLEAFLTDP